jgi:hypothetical protein
MPPVLLIGAVAGAALSAGMAVAAGTVVFGLSVALSAAVIFGISLVGTLALGMISQALQGQPKEPNTALSPSQEAASRTQMVRSAVMSRRIVVGRCVVSGPMVFAQTHADPTARRANGSRCCRAPESGDQIAGFFQRRHHVVRRCQNLRSVLPVRAPPGSALRARR